jgi:hypothetical protein
MKYSNEIEIKPLVGINQLIVIYPPYTKHSSKKRRFGLRIIFCITSATTKSRKVREGT